MWPFSKKLKSYNWKKEHSRLWEELVPADGQAETLQGELIRIAGKLTDQAFRNGNMNWDDDHETMWRFVGNKLVSDSTFSKKEKNEIKEKVEQIIEENGCPDLGDDNPFYFISEKVVDYCMANETLIDFEPDEKLKR